MKKLTGCLLFSILLLTSVLAGSAERQASSSTSPRVSAETNDTAENFGYLHEFLENHYKGLGNSGASISRDNVHFVDASEDNHALAGRGRSAKDLLDAVGPAGNARIVFAHDALSRGVTTYAVKGPLVFESNMDVYIEKGAVLDNDVSIRSAVYRWTASGKGTNEYYLQLAGGGNPGITEPSTVVQNSFRLRSAAAGSLPSGQWAWADNDGLGYNTVYVRLRDGADPNTKAEDSIEAGYTVAFNGPCSWGDYPVFPVTSNGLFKFGNGYVPTIKSVWFGFSPASSAFENKVAMLAMFDSKSGMKANPVFTILNGAYEHEGGDVYSVNENDVGSMVDRIDGTVTIHADGAEITFTGSNNHCLTFMGRAAPGAATDPPKWVLIGGRYIGAPTSKSVFRLQECNMGIFQPETIMGRTSGPDVTDHGILVQNIYSWTENLQIGGGRRVSFLGTFDTLIDLQGGAAAKAYGERTSATVGESLSRIRLDNLFIRTAVDYCLKISGNWYDGYASQWSGNVDSSVTKAIIHYSGNHGTRRTRVTGIHLEGRKANHADVPIVDRKNLKDPSKFLDMSDCTWTFYPAAEGNGYPPIETYGGEVTLTRGRAVRIVSREALRNNAMWLVMVKSGANDVNGAVIVMKQARGEGIALIAVGNVTGGSFSVASNDLMFTNSTGANLNVSITALGLVQPGPKTDVP